MFSGLPSSDGYSFFVLSTSQAVPLLHVSPAQAALGLLAAANAARESAMVLGWFCFFSLQLGWCWALDLWQSWGSGDSQDPLWVSLGVVTTLRPYLHSSWCSALRLPSCLSS